MEIKPQHGRPCEGFGQLNFLLWGRIQRRGGEGYFGPLQLAKIALPLTNTELATLIVNGKKALRMVEARIARRKAGTRIRLTDEGHRTTVARRQKRLEALQQAARDAARTDADWHEQQLREREKQNFGALKETLRNIRKR